MTTIRRIDANNHLNYEIIKDNYILAKQLLFDDCDRISYFISEYYEFFREKMPNIEFLTTFPGTTHPLVVDAHINYLESFGLKYDIIYGDTEVKTLNEYNRILRPMVQACNTYMNLNQIPRKVDPKIAASCCNYDISQYAVSRGFLSTTITSALRSSTTMIVSPVVYYSQDSNNFLINPSPTKPDTGAIFMSALLDDMFTKYKIQIVDKKPKYLPKN